MSTGYLPARPMMGWPSPAAAAKESSILSQGGLAVFLLGVASGIPVMAVGKLFVGELILMAVAPLVALLLLTTRDQYGKTARVIFIALLVSWLGYVGSDFYRNTELYDYLRGWSRWIATGASFATLAWLGSKNIRYVVFFLVGLSVGTVATPFIYGMPVDVKYIWKFYGAIPLTILALYAIGRFRWLAIALLLALSVLTVALDNRASALVFMMTAGVTFLAARRSSSNSAGLRPTSKTSIIAAVVLMAGVLLSAVYLINYLGNRYGYSERFQNSNDKRYSSAVVTWAAIKNSPIIGYGSWPKSPELARLRDKLAEKLMGSKAGRNEVQRDAIIAHSQILQGWLEGGLLGLVFFIVLAWQLCRSLLWLASESPYYSWLPVCALVQFQCAWHLVFSPFGGSQRVLIPAACAFLCFIAAKRQEIKAVRASYMPAYIPWQAYPTA